jgi:Tol biopolymer transport system component
MNRLQKGLIAFGMLSVVALGKLAYDYCTHVSLTPLAWSPDGRTVVVNIENDLSETTGSVGLASAKTGRLERVLFENRGGLACSRAAFSSDGRSIAFEHMGLHVVDLATDRHRALAEGASPKWLMVALEQQNNLVRKSADGQWIAGVRRDKNGEYSLAGARKGSCFLSAFVPRLDFYNGTNPPQWSAANELVYWDTQARPAGIYAFSPDTETKRFLMEGYAPLVSPDGKRLAYVQNGDLKFLETVADIPLNVLGSTL